MNRKLTVKYLKFKIALLKFKSVCFTTERSYCYKKLSKRIEKETQDLKKKIDVRYILHWNI